MGMYFYLTKMICKLPALSTLSSVEGAAVDEYLLNGKVEKV